MGAGDPGNVVANVTVKAAEPAGRRRLHLPMEFTPSASSWQLTRQTADQLLQLGEAPTANADPLSDRMWIGWLEFDLLLGDVHR